MRIACIGEGMIEIAEVAGNPTLAHLGYGGDTLNTALYLARLLACADGDHSAAYITRLGDDPYSASMLESWRAQGVKCDLIAREKGRVPGLYAVHLDDNGERRFSYWRAQAPVREMFEGADGAGLIARLNDFDGIFFSGITLAILRRQGRGRLLDLAGAMAAKGRTVAFDTNYRARLWEDDDARAANAAALRAATVALPSAEDLAGLFGDAVSDWADFLNTFDIPEIVLKHGGDAVDVFADGMWRRVALGKIAHPLDTTAAGDSFNAGYLAARIVGRAPIDAVAPAHALAGAVIGHRGAIIPIEAMPAIF
ncbi:sugar kinase [Varunaivibrio sulfuroxidans]|uniref:2-dehydro-3-deoxygluconokinase n=1 Tax=Varunaivibrio sulfuroxidans TaxID=1773489 RepID=A0A4R3J7Q5_9PROT|nr:sugar kinase [Varunaivibrio sulfuroxidans]TCS60943.1 2-dehydro-3-deoxygluconokinase [Varunaivibrio sulfuroxidans]WES31649.1 sugar kinase [Varunaivibrio sulfuroxidans]